MEYKDNTGRPYYVNSLTEESTWSVTRPTAFDDSDVRELPPLWRLAYSASGAKFWFHVVHKMRSESHPRSSGNHETGGSTSGDPVEKRPLEEGTGENPVPKKKRKKKKKSDGPSTYIRIEGLPQAATDADVKTFACRCGVLKTDELTGEVKLKVRRDEEGQCTGVAVVGFLKPESVALALQLLDGDIFSGGGKPLKVNVHVLLPQALFSILTHTLVFLTGVPRGAVGYG